MLTASALAALALAASPLEIEGSVAAGAGYDSNLSHDHLKSLQVGSGYTTARGAGGASLDVTESTNVYAGLRLEGEMYPSVTGLSTGSLGVEVALEQDLSGSVALILAPTAARSWYGDSTRDSTVLGAKLTLRVDVVDPVTLRASYGHTRRDASNAVFSYDRDRLGASLELRLAAATYLTAAVAVEFGPDVFYAATSGGGGMMGGGTLMGTFGRTDQAFRDSATSYTPGLALEVGLGGDAFLEASYDLRMVRSSAGDYQNHEVAAGLGWRF